MMSVLPNGGRRPALRCAPSRVALDDVSATEWRICSGIVCHFLLLLHSMMSVLPNGG